jgi:DNA invertase Pin-like site-specific DNA recombinase
MVMKVGYARVSITGQSLEVQLEALKNAGCEPDSVYQEKRSGKSVDGRPQLQAALKFIRKGDTLVVTKLDRLARSVYDLHKIAQQLKEKAADLVVLNQADIDTTSKYGKLIFTILGAVAELERDLILERTAEGREKAKTAGVHMGRHATVDPDALANLKKEAKKW